MPQLGREGTSMSWLHGFAQQGSSIRFHNTHSHAQQSSGQQHEQHAGTKPRAGSLDPKEAAKFAAMSAAWWDPSGPFAPLHRFNPARCKFIRQAVCAARKLPQDHLKPLTGLRVLDVGCGGGILSESLGRMGAEVSSKRQTWACTEVLCGVSDAQLCSCKQGFGQAQ